MTPTFRVVYHTSDSLIAESRIACRKHILAKPTEIVEEIIDETWDSDLFCEDCVKAEAR